MSQADTPSRADGLLTLAAADALWPELLSNSAVPAALEAFTSLPADARSGHVLLGSHLVPTVQDADDRWHVQEVDVRRAAADLRSVKVNRNALVHIAPCIVPSTGQEDAQALRWRQRLDREWSRVRDHDLHDLSWQQAGNGDLRQLAGIDWRRALVVRPKAEAAHTWWLPRTLTQVLDAAERTETQWLLAARVCSRCGAYPDDRPEAQRMQTGRGQQTICSACSNATLRPYTRELEGLLYSALSKKRSSLEVSGWRCAVCQEAAASVIDHCHEHGYVRAPVCQACNTRERPNYLYRNDIYVTDRYVSLFHSHAQDWLRHWHRCPGCRARTTLPLPHLAALTAVLVGAPMRPTHRVPHSSRGRIPCGELRASWTGSHNQPRSCMITLSVDYCPGGEHRILAKVPYRTAVDRFRTWLAEMAPEVAAAAGPSRYDTVPAQFRPVIPDTSSPPPSLF
ncbi:endonuclease domain-containing protein [Streptomyces sp. NPDC088354]|uniref:endonuclease domain-containing protein n=1 Tax=Streptomyces sp. NPDC088354 TaxID=3365856 RepID=UPI0037F3195B